MSEKEHPETASQRFDRFFASLNPSEQRAVAILGVFMMFGVAIPATGALIVADEEIRAHSTDPSNIVAGRPGLVLRTDFGEEHCRNPWSALLCSSRVYNHYLIVEQCPGRMPTPTDLPDLDKWSIPLGKTASGCVIDRVQVDAPTYDQYAPDYDETFIPGRVVFDGPDGETLSK